MLLRCIKSENLKLQHSLIFPACIVIPIIPAIMGTFNYLQNTGILTQQWYSLWTQHTLFYACFFYAPLIALYSSYLWRLEHRNNNWNVIMTAPVSIPCLYLGKLAVIIQVTFITQMWVGILYVICGRLIGLSGFCPVEIFFWLLRGTIASMAIGALQLLLSMVIRSFSVPIGIALMGGVLGMLLFNKGIGFYWPYSLMIMGMNSSRTEDVIAGNTLPFLLSTLVFFFIFCLTAIQVLKARDVHT